MHSNDPIVAQYERKGNHRDYCACVICVALVFLTVTFSSEHQTTSQQLWTAEGRPTNLSHAIFGLQSVVTNLYFNKSVVWDYYFFQVIRLAEMAFLRVQLKSQVIWSQVYLKSQVIWSQVYVKSQVIWSRVMSSRRSFGHKIKSSRKSFGHKYMSSRKSFCHKLSQVTGHLVTSYV